MARDAFLSVVKSTSHSVDTVKKIKQLMMKAVGQRDMSIQEVMHQSLSLKLFSSSFEVVSLSFDGMRKLQNEEGEVVTQSSFLDNYAFRQNFVEEEPTIMYFNCIQFLGKFVVKKQKASQTKK